MRFLVLVLFVSTANLFVSANNEQEIEFPVKLLEPDFRAIEWYHEKIEQEADAFVFLPNNDFDNHIVLQIKREEIANKRYLKIGGNFKIMQRRKYITYESLLYRDNSFYLYDAERSSMKPLAEENTLRHTAIITSNIMSAFRPSNRKPGLVIRYFSLKEIENYMDPFYKDNKDHMETAIEKSPATFLAIAPEPLTQFVEYTLSSRTHVTPEADENLLVLVGKREDGILRLRSSLEASKLVYDQYGHSFSVRDSRLSSLQDVYAVRMASKGFLAELGTTRLRLLSMHDLRIGTSHAQHKVFQDDFLKKVRNTEPKDISRYAPSYTGLQRPKSAKLQVMGHILVKSINDDDVDGKCPMIINYDSKKTLLFGFGCHVTEKICTDDTTLWAYHIGKPDQKVAFNRFDFVTLMNPEA